MNQLSNLHISDYILRCLGMPLSAVNVILMILLVHVALSSSFKGIKGFPNHLKCFS